MATKLDSLYRVQRKDVRRVAIMLSDAFLHDPVWQAVLGDATLAQRTYAFETPILMDRRENMSGKPYIYLQIIGVAPTFQGQGYAGKLLRALIEKSEQTGVSLYLETETESNVSLYEHFGFTVIKKIVLPIINLPMWEMIRAVKK